MSEPKDINAPAFAAAVAYLNAALYALGQAGTKLGHGHRDTVGLGERLDECHHVESLAMALRDRVLKLKGQT